ncbi:NAD(P)-dependent dehydrogenase (short-subunit alcohol dehydrogenase family) [Paenibacillus sp. W4I10]|uniref:hypothetical protein n=1 Tax=Paenibacillus TaxID=44249 RepID=UPI002785555D|nr:MULTISPECIES: hypothetical protein [unclassified Paenibacillus]MDQ0718809.1 NAD(P)-dependent dehydrogenase (short-subunit alcohol dehydrogenase family) [Paenibacillus sp. W4I10]MDR6718286.1 NAD(P)-dependent dehydrogenase (short-subunit alcohol dehydrogenase family) [Paenibacillus sp. 2003]
MTTIAGQMLASKVVMITGAGRGIGAEAAKAMMETSGSGSIVNTSSVGSSEGESGIGSLRGI